MNNTFKLLDELFAPLKEFQLTKFGLGPAISWGILIDNNLVFEVELPGIKKENVTVEYNDNNLHIAWKDRKGIWQAEDYPVSDKFDISGTTSKLLDGILSVSIPKIEEKVPVKKQIKID